MIAEAPNSSKLKKIVIGTVVTLGICALTFSGLTQSVRAEAGNETDNLPAVSSSTDSKELKELMEKMKSVMPDKEWQVFKEQAEKGVLGQEFVSDQYRIMIRP
jgi:cell division septation protein DedD